MSFFFFANPLKKQLYSVVLSFFFSLLLLLHAYPSAYNTYILATPTTRCHATYIENMLPPHRYGYGYAVRREEVCSRPSGMSTLHYGRGNMIIRNVIVVPTYFCFCRYPYPSDQREMAFYILLLTYYTVMTF